MFKCSNSLYEHINGRTLGPSAVLASDSMRIGLNGAVTSVTIVVRYTATGLGRVKQRSSPLLTATQPLRIAPSDRHNVTGGMSLVRRGSTAYHLTGAELGTVYCTALLAGACEIAGQVEEGLSLLDDACRSWRGQRSAGFRRICTDKKATCCFIRATRRPPKEFYLKSIAIAVEQKAKLRELRAATSLARLRAIKAGEARRTTSSHRSTACSLRVFHIADLKEARLFWTTSADAAWVEATRNDPRGKDPTSYWGGEWQLSCRGQTMMLEATDSTAFALP
jgi:hypothetical protein